MAVVYNQVSVSAVSPTLILAANTTSTNYSEGMTSPNRYLTLTNASGTTIYIGDSAVTALTGMAVLTATQMAIWLHPDESLYALSASGSKVLSYIATGN